MGRHLNKKQYRLRAMKIIELRDKEGLLFSQIAERMGVHQWTVERSYRQYKGEKHD